MNKKPIIEITKFKLSKKTTDQEFITEAEIVQTNFLQKQKGYIDRELLKNQEGQWMDILHWESLEEAQKAAETMINEPTTKGFIEKIDPESIEMLHFKQIKAWNK